MIKKKKKKARLVVKTTNHNFTNNFYGNQEMSRDSTTACQYNTGLEQSQQCDMLSISINI
jgi:hypothetical protein